MNERIHAHLTRAGGYKYEVTFDELPGVKIVSDEPTPIGKSEGVTAAMMLSGAVGHCLCSSLLFCLEKSRVKAKDLSANVELAMERNEKGRWRVKEIKVDLKPIVDEADAKKMDRCKDMFEEFCIVSSSVREGIRIDVNIERE
jgi:organic hydroperoxide reductase OsmC/OhrA